MTTQINVNVDNGGLSAKARQQTQANRWARLEQDGRTKAEQRGLQQRNAERLTRGIGPDGRPLYGTAPTQQGRRDEPVARRVQQQGLNLGHLWVAYPNDVTTNSTGIAAIGGGGGLSDLVTRTVSNQSALRVGNGIGTNWVELDYGAYNHPPLPSETWTVYDSQPQGSGSFNYKATRELRYQMTQASSMAWFVLPAGRGTFLLVFCDKAVYYGINATVKHVAEGPAGYTPADNPSNPYLAAFSYDQGGDTGYTAASSYGESTVRNRVYVCSNSSIRAITTFSPTLQQVFDTLNPPPTSGTTTATINGQSFAYNALYNSGILGGSSDIFSGGNGFRKTIDDQNGGENLVYTPYVFELINDYVPFASGQLKQFDPKLRWGLPDESAGGYARFVPGSSATPTYQAAYDDGLTMHHALWKNKNEVPDRRVFDPAYAYLGLPAPRRVNKASLSLAAERVSQSQIYQLVTVWDWDDPAYCRQMCLALGFAEADLTP